jgi:quercetin dioxygenase-like cupin family protein
MTNMRKMSSDGADLVEGFGVQCGRWTQYEGLGEVPFGAMWCVVPPGGATQEDVHDERELVIVADGIARLGSPRGDGTFERAEQGAAVLFDGGEPHVVHNLSDEHPLVLLCLYWLPTAVANGAGHEH